MITVHHLGISQSERIVWLCEELEIPYRLERYERDPVTRLAPPAYKALHPLGTAPIVTDGELVLPESGAIIEYIVAKYGEGRLRLPPEHPDFPDYLFWFHFANASMMPNLMGDMICTLAGGGSENSIAQMLNARKQSAFALIERRLGEASYFAGEQFTAADIIMLFPLTTMRNFVPIDFAEFPNLRAYLKRIGERPAYRRAMAKADPELAPNLD